MPTRHYFTKAQHAKHRLHLRQSNESLVADTPLPRKSQFDLVTVNGVSRRVNSRWAALQRIRSANATSLHVRGVAHVWTSETARTAAIASWRKRGKLNKRINKRLGRPSKNRPRVMRQPLRDFYESRRVGGIQYHRRMLDPHPKTGALGYWTCDNGDRVLSERQALIKLGHLPSQHGWVPPKPK